MNARHPDPRSDSLPEPLEESLRRWSRAFPYPPTPDMAKEVGRRLGAQAAPARTARKRLAWMGAAVLLLIAALLAVPPVRAQVLELLQMGAVRIRIADPTPIPTQASAVEATALASATPGSIARIYPWLAELAGETTLAEARQELDFPIPLPGYPPELGEPDHVFLQDLGGPAVLLVWLDPGEPAGEPAGERGRIRLDLLVMGPGTYGEKVLTQAIDATQVNGQPAVWAQGPHTLQLGGDTYDEVPLVVEGNVLIWQEGGITYRLESDLTMEEAVRIAESLAVGSPAPETPLETSPTAVPGAFSAPEGGFEMAELPVTAAPFEARLDGESCPVTQPQEPVFTPPYPYPAKAAYEGWFWYGTEELWTMLRLDGTWRGLPYHGDGYVQKVFWWNASYDPRAEPAPEFKVTGRRLDGAAPLFETDNATNTVFPNILTGVELPSLGCWEISGSYRGHTLSFVVWVEP